MVGHISVQKKLAILGRDMIPRLQKNHQITEKKLTYIPRWSAIEVKIPLAFDESQFTQKWSLQDKFVVQYSGNMGPRHDMITFVHTARKLRKQTQIQFVFIGGGIQRKIAERLSKKLAIPNIQWENFVPFTELTHSLAACHLSLLSLNQGLEGIAAPCKLYGILASGRAVIAQVPENSEIAMVVREHECGVVVPPGNEKQLSETILTLLNDRAKVDSMGKKAFQAYQQHYRLQHAVTAFQSFLN